jgi:hypothetical protein
MRDQQPIRTARRTVHREDRLGLDALCIFCGYACTESLTVVSRAWLEARLPRVVIDSLLERHHTFGRVHDPDSLITLCLNCHREITEGLMREGVSMRPERNSQKRIALMLRACAVLFESLAASFRKWATLIEDDLEKGSCEHES